MCGLAVPVFLTESVWFFLTKEVVSISEVYRVVCCCFYLVCITRLNSSSKKMNLKGSVRCKSESIPEKKNNGPVMSMFLFIMVKYPY